jgi:2-(1,2-epoxy-1,2-dihydrophenyl)acetyl-CoA isomerase
MDRPTVLMAVSEGVAHITLNAPSSGNALDLGMANGLHKAFQAAADDDDVRVVLLSGSGRLFCAGGDLRAVQAAADRGRFMLSLARAAHDAVRLMANLDKPIITAVTGAAAGAGLSLVLLSDIVVASRAAKFMTAYTRVGLTPDCGQSWLLPRVIGLGRALELTLDSRALTAEEAQALGLVSRLVDEGTELTFAHSLAARLASGPAHAAGSSRALIRGSFGEGFEAHLEREALAISAAARVAMTGTLIDDFLGETVAPPSPRASR